jgi:hypothetical protein
MYPHEEDPLYNNVRIDGCDGAHGTLMCLTTTKAEDCTRIQPFNVFVNMSMLDNILSYLKGSEQIAAFMGDGTWDIVGGETRAQMPLYSAEEMIGPKQCFAESSIVSTVKAEEVLPFFKLPKDTVFKRTGYVTISHHAIQMCNSHIIYKKDSYNTETTNEMECIPCAVESILAKSMNEDTMIDIHRFEGNDLIRFEYTQDMEDEHPVLWTLTTNREKNPICMVNAVEEQAYNDVAMLVWQGLDLPMEKQIKYITWEGTRDLPKLLIAKIHYETSEDGSRPCIITKRYEAKVYKDFKFTTIAPSVPIKGAPTSIEIKDNANIVNFIVNKEWSIWTGKIKL